MSTWLFLIFQFTPLYRRNHVSIGCNWSCAGDIADHIYHDDGKGKWVFTYDDKGNVVLPKKYETISDANYNIRGAKGPTAVFNDYYNDKVEYDYAAKDLLAFQKVNGKDEALKEITPVPPMLKTADEMASITQIQTQIKNIVNSYRMKWIMEGKVDETWDKYKSELEAAGLSKLVSIYQGAYDRYKSNMKK
jgi:putative aldouronate transport system substrate-binding protein